MPGVKISVWLPGLLALIPACGFAQVTVNPAALRQLQGLPPVAAAPAVRPAMAKPPVHETAPHRNHPTTPHKPAPAKPVPAKPAPALPAPTLPPGKPPIVPPPTAKPATPKPTIPTLVKIEFGPGSAILPADASAALKPFCTAGATVPVLTRAPADPSDPSSAMRLSMARAFAIRDALTACGVPASHIIPRAAGSEQGADNNEAEIGASAKP